jgi:hypothetical protein
MGIGDQQSKPQRIPLPSSDKNRKTRTDDIVCARLFFAKGCGKSLPQPF